MRCILSDHTNACIHGPVLHGLGEERDHQRSGARPRKSVVYHACYVCMRAMCACASCMRVWFVCMCAMFDRVRTHACMISVCVDGRCETFPNPNHYYFNGAKWFALQWKWNCFHVRLSWNDLQMVFKWLWNQCCFKAPCIPPPLIIISIIVITIVTIFTAVRYLHMSRLWQDRLSLYIHIYIYIYI